MVSPAARLKPHYQAGVGVRIGGIGTNSSKDAYEHVEQPLSKEQQQQEKPNKTNPGLAQTVFTAHTMLDEELVLSRLPCQKCDKQHWEVRSGFSMICMQNHAKSRGTRCMKSR